MKQILTGTALLAPMLLSCQSDKNQMQQKMNILYIMTDDHAYQAISAYGDPLSVQAPTPNLDRLAARGILFQNAYVENSLSTPSRACLMTGLFSHQNGQTMLSNVMDSTVTFVPELLQKAGYQTGMIGKWHMLCEPRGFDMYRVLRDQGEYYNPGFKTPDTNGEYVPTEGYATQVTTDYAIDFLENRDKSKPFALFVHHKAPHRNWMPDIKYLDLYEDVEFPMPETFYDDYATRGQAAHDQRMSIDKDMKMDYDLKVPGWLEYGTEEEKVLSMYAMYNISRMNPEDKEKYLASYAKKNEWILANKDKISHEELVKWKYQRYVKDYLRVIKSVDDSVGELLDYLEEHDLMDNTVIVYTSDQGFYMGEHGWFDKRFMYEQSFRTPLIISYPGCKQGVESKTLVQNIDYGPTFLDLAGVEKPSNMYGMSIVPVLKNNGEKPEEWREYLYYHFYDHTAEHNVMRHDGVFDNRYKLIHFYDEEGKLPSYDEFYDLEADPDEMHNAIDDPKYADKIQALNAQLSKMRSDFGVTEF